MAKGNMLYRNIRVLPQCTVAFQKPQYMYNAPTQVEPLNHYAFRNSFYKHSAYIRFNVFTAVTMNNGVFWDVTPFGSCKNRRFGGRRNIPEDAILHSAYTSQKRHYIYKGKTKP
jgi:hypothetical protein